MLLFIVFTGVSFTSCKHELPGGDIPPGPPPVPGVNCSPDTVYFQQQVLPILISNCSMSGCHDAASHQDGVVLTNYSNVMITGQVQPGNPGNSELWKKINDSDPGDRMPPPPLNRLTQEQSDAIRKWILQGAKNNSCASSVCDTTNVSYSGMIKNIISLKCQGCHSTASASGGIDLSNYAGVKTRVNDGSLWGSINHTPGYTAMPQNGNKLSVCELNQIKKWMDADAPNN
ncbi:MAG: c-type cytochrome domain-containing protein [Flavisolibacter sp.]